MAYLDENRTQELITETKNRLAGKQDKLQYSTLPTASAELEGKIFEYTGATGGGLTHGYFYECVSDGESEPTYSWQQTNVQPSSGGGTDYTAGDGIDITDDTISIDPMSAEDMDEVIDELPTGGNMAVAGYVPLGTLIPFYGETAPKFFLACDGSTYNKADYPELAKHLLSLTNNTPYIVDGDDTKFKVPDLRGEFIRGTGTNSHENQGSGDSVGVHQDGTEIYPMISETATILRNNVDSTRSANGSWKGSANGSSGSQPYFSSRPTNTSVLFCIAYKDIYSNPMNDYSTDEKVVGTWIDGSPLYQRSYKFENFSISSSDTQKNFGDISSLSIDYGMVVETLVDDGGYLGSNWVDVFIRKAEGNFGAVASKTISNKTIYITIQYTKTTA